MKSPFTKKLFIIYPLVAFALALFLYFVPDYFFLEKLTAILSARILQALIPVTLHIENHAAYVNGIQIVRECTGIQVIAVFTGLILPIRSSWLKRVRTLAILSAVLFLINALRIAIEILIFELKFVSWQIAHVGLSVVLGIIGVYLLTIMTDIFLPEFGDWIAQYWFFLKTKYENIKRKNIK